MTAPVAGHCFPPQKLPPELPPTARYRAVLHSTALMADSEKREKNKIVWHGAVSPSTGKRVFQDRCLKPLGHPSIEGFSST